MRAILLLSLLTITCLGAERKPVVPASAAKPVGPYSPGMWAGDTLYVSGQGARDSEGKLPEGIEAQTRQTMENVKAIVEAGGLTMADVVYTHAYLDNMANEPAMRKVWAGYFPGKTPANITVGVAKLPTGTPVEISAIAVKGGQAPRLYVGAQPSRGALRRTLHAAKLTESHLVAVTVYYVESAYDEAQREVFGLERMQDGPAVQAVRVVSLPGNGKLSLTAVAALQKTDRKVQRDGHKTTCAAAGDMIYCAAQGGSGGDMSAQVNAAINTLDASLKALGADLSRAVANNVYMNRIEQFADMNKVYGERFPSPPPTRTTVQPQTPDDRIPLARIAVVAVR